MHEVSVQLLVLCLSCLPVRQQ